jgi:hypothetical protein
MASKRILKRNLNNMVIDVVEECFTIQLIDQSKVELADAVIDEAAAFQDTLLRKINLAKTKADFRPITNEIENGAVNFIQKLNALS